MVCCVPIPCKAYGWKPVGAWRCSDLLAILYKLYALIVLGMNGHEVLNRVEKGYRMQRPTGGPIECPAGYYETMTKCWTRIPESRPTFAYLQDFFDNYFIAVEEAYKGPDD